MIPVLVFVLGFILVVVGVLALIFYLITKFTEAKNFIISSIQDHCDEKDWEYMGNITTKMRPLKEFQVINICELANIAEYGVKADMKDRQMIFFKYLGYSKQGEKWAEYNVLLTRMDFKEPLIEYRCALSCPFELSWIFGSHGPDHCKKCRPAN